MKKGFTLIELIIAIALASVLLSISSKVILTSIRLFKNEEQLDRDMFYLKETAIYIEGQLQNDSKSVEINNSRLIIHKLNENRGDISVRIRKEIYLNNKKKLVTQDYEDNRENGAPNNIMTKVKIFNCSIAGNLIYISIESENGDKIERCIEINPIG